MTKKSSWNLYLQQTRESAIRFKESPMGLKFEKELKNKNRR